MWAILIDLEVADWVELNIVIGLVGVEWLMGLVLGELEKVEVD
jgi:hypothetical protein